MLNKLVLLPVLLLLAIGQPCGAQQAALQPLPLFTPLHTPLLSNNMRHQNTGIIFTHKSFETDIQPATNYNLHYILPKGAIFCRMEDALYKHFNFRLKFRMGNDDRYSD